LIAAITHLAFPRRVRRAAGPQLPGTAPVSRRILNVRSINIPEMALDFNPAMPS
jgi:hypothetical protein